MTKSEAHDDPRVLGRGRRAGPPTWPAVCGSSRGLRMFLRTRKGVTSLVTSGLLAASLGGALAAAPSAAAAAYPWCTSSAWTQSADTTWTTRPSTSSTDTTCVMAQGSTGAGVTSLQKALRHCYGRNIAIDGVFGPATEAALKYAQGRAGVSQDGEYGPVTRNAILWGRYSIETGAKVRCT
ncbi:peptidoglycan-binding domain-containing protein [Streptomyces prasinus]